MHTFAESVTGRGEQKVVKVVTNSVNTRYMDAGGNRAIWMTKPIAIKRGVNQTVTTLGGEGGGVVKKRHVEI